MCSLFHLLAFLSFLLFFSFFTGGHFSEVICRHWTQNHGYTVLESKNKGERGRKIGRVCVWLRLRVIPKMVDGQSCMFLSLLWLRDKGVRKRGWLLSEKRGVVDELQSEQTGVLWFSSPSHVSTATVAPSEQSHLKSRTRHKMCTQSNLHTNLFLLTEKSWKGGILVNYGSLQSAKITVNCCHLQGALTHYGIFPS